MRDLIQNAGPGVRSFTSTVLPPGERGLEFGRTFPQQIQSTIDFYRSLLSRCPRPDVDLEGGGARALEAIERFSPAAAAELHGIANGAGLPIEAIAGINARTELLALADPDGTVECSTVVSAPASGPVRGAQTWDWYSAMADGWLQWTIPFPDGRTLSTVTEFGILAKIGINSAGLGVLFSILHHERDGGNRVGVPVHVLARTALEQAKTIAGATVLADRAERSASSTLTILDRSEAKALELFPGGMGLQAPRDQWLTHTNHFLSAEGSPGCRDRTTGVNSVVRIDALNSHIRSHRDATDAGLLSALSGHDPAGRLCVHASPETSESTLATVIIDTSEPSLSVWRGWPCAVSDR